MVGSDGWLLWLVAIVGCDAVSLSLWPLIIFPTRGWRLWPFRFSSMTTVFAWNNHIWEKSSFPRIEHCQRHNGTRLLTHYLDFTLRHLHFLKKNFEGNVLKRLTAVLQHLKQQVANGRDDNSADLRPLVAVVVQPDLWDRVQQCTCADLQPDLKQPWSWSRILQHLFSQTQKVGSGR